MSEKSRVDCYSAADREALAVILVKNGYTVRQGREKRGKSSMYTWFIEFWRDGGCSSSR